jgi:ABC-type antimicrobial peptide transport system permease subunit
VVPLEEVPNEEAFFFQLFGLGMLLLGGAALALSIAGVYAITSLTVVRRTREIGVRRALGASPALVLGLVSRAAASQLALGTALGAGLGLLLAEVIGSLSGGLHTGGPGEPAGVALAIGVVVLAACLLPAIRALRLTPLEALREE